MKYFIVIVCVVLWLFVFVLPITPIGDKWLVHDFVMEGCRHGQYRKLSIYQYLKLKKQGRIEGTYNKDWGDIK